jgi:hypothetical protein
MRRTLLLTLALSAAPAFGQGLGVTPAVPDGPSALTVTPAAGPWMLLAASYGGDSARAQAEELATELRTRYQLPAYVFNRTAEERRQEQERVAKLREEWRKRIEADHLPPDAMPHIRTVSFQDQYAVLVGGYKDAATARKELDKFRKLRPSDKLINNYAYVPDPKTGAVREEAVNPFLSAFVCHNPTIPVEKPKEDPQQAMKNLKRFNAGEPYSLLKCPKPFTLVVKAYKCEAKLEGRGQSGSIMERMGMEREFAGVLNANANQAHQVAEFLRKFGFEAYVLHTEYNSYVTIGSFDGQDDPRLPRMQQAFVNEMNNPNSNVGQLHGKAMVQFLAQPMPFPVPQAK